MTEQAYPLSWPDGWPRTPYGRSHGAKSSASSRTGAATSAPCTAKKARTRHPDAGGTDTLMSELNVAYAEAKRELGAN